jgi:hypothetical protein
MAVKRDGLQISGLAETIQAARAGADKWGKAVTQEIRQAITPIRNEARQKFEALGGTGPMVAQTVRVSVSSRGAAVVAGGGKVGPFMMGREFGADRLQTRPFQRRVQSGRLISRKVGGGEKRTMIARIPYAKESIFGPWTGNQFVLGFSGGRLNLGQVSGRAFYPSVGAGAEKVYRALEGVAERTIAAFPDEIGRTQAALAERTVVASLNDFLSRGGL